MLIQNEELNQRYLASFTGLLEKSTFILLSVISLSLIGIAEGMQYQKTMGRHGKQPLFQEITRQTTGKLNL